MVRFKSNIFIILKKENKYRNRIVELYFLINTQIKAGVTRDHLDYFLRIIKNYINDVRSKILV